MVMVRGGRKMLTSSASQFRKSGFTSKGPGGPRRRPGGGGDSVGGSICGEIPAGGYSSGGRWVGSHGALKGWAALCLRNVAASNAALGGGIGGATMVPGIAINGDAAVAEVASRTGSGEVSTAVGTEVVLYSLVGSWPRSSFLRLEDVGLIDLFSASETYFLRERVLWHQIEGLSRISMRIQPRNYASSSI